jgi:hypothetical protein
MALLDGYVTTPFNDTQLSSPERDPSVIEYGSSFFSSYQALNKGGSKFIHGLNLAKSSDGFRHNLQGASVVACKVMQDTGSFLAWELGHEPDTYAVAGPKVRLNVGGIKVGGLGAVRDSSWDEKAFVSQWMSVTTDLKLQMSYACPNLPTKYVAPGFAGDWDAWKTYNMGMSKAFVGQFAAHRYASSKASEINANEPVPWLLQPTT